MRFLVPAAVYLTSLLSPVANAAYDQNRAGAVLKAPEDGSFTSVTGTFTVPDISGSNKLSIWVAIGDTLQQDVVLKGGVHYADSKLSSFVSWYPGDDTDITGEVPVAAGDTITVTVTVPAEDKSTGTVVVENTAQGAQSSQTVQVPESVDPAALTSLAADWFVQAYQEAGELVQVPQFGTVSFTAAGATLASGEEVGTTGAGTFVSNSRDQF
ncbi:hypothetical protein SLS62_002348 [Diatrype stigma]|uniref:Uncharacterized protein n=1 Tax=Diatrype stigma TaxID=117547 RepID=A0AAN9YVV1_9PEZI